MTSIVRKKILVVDDNEMNLKLFILLLSSPTYEIRTASAAAEALEVLSSFHPDLLLLDLQLPDMDGLELARRLKADPRTRALPIIAVTAYAMKGDEQKVRDAGIDGYLSKPIDKSVFRRTVAEFLEKEV